MIFYTTYILFVYFVDVLFLYTPVNSQRPWFLNFKAFFSSGLFFRLLLKAEFDFPLLRDRRSFCSWSLIVFGRISYFDSYLLANAQNSNVPASFDSRPFVFLEFSSDKKYVYI